MLRDFKEEAQKKRLASQPPPLRPDNSIMKPKETVMNKILREKGISVSEYIADLYNNTPHFDELPITFNDHNSTQQLWGMISKMLLSPDAKE